MAVPRLTIKGQVTIPHSVRSALNLKPGDGVVFVMESDRAVLVPIKRKSLTELRGALRVGKRLGIEEERRLAREQMAAHITGVGQQSEC